MRPFIDLTGQRFGKLTVIDPLSRRHNGNRSMFWLCRCDCGGSTEARADALKSGAKLSCGCLRGGRRPDPAKAGRRVHRKVTL